MSIFFESSWQGRQKRIMYGKGEGELDISFTGYPPILLHCSNAFQKYTIEEYSYLKETEVLLQQDKLL